MQIMVLDSKKITKMTLPNVIEGAYSMEYKPESLPVKKTINIEAQDGKWIFVSNGEVNAIYDGIETSGVTLEEYGYFKVRIANVAEELLIYPLPTTETNCYKLINNIPSITIGKDNTSAICYDNEFMLANHATITRIEGTSPIWRISCPNESVVYLNNNRVINSQLKMGDIIFIYGMKILWLGDFMFIYNPQNKVNVANVGLAQYVEETVDNTKYTPVSDSETFIELHNINDYFFHTFKIKPSYAEEEVNIDSPPEKQNSTEPPLLITMGGSVVMFASSFLTASSILNGLKDPEKTINDFIPQIIMLAAMIFASLFMPRITRLYQKNMLRLREKRRQREYTKYLQNKGKEIDAIITEQKRVLRENNPLLKEVYGIAVSSNSRARWSREVKDEDFLSIRLGSGTVPAKLKIKPVDDGFRMEEDNLKDLLIELANKQYNLEDVPVVFSLLENTVSALVCQGSFVHDYLNALILQLTTFHSAQDLKLVFLLNDPNVNRWEYLKYMPHTLSSNKDIRFFATDTKEIKAVCSYLDEEYNYRKEIANSSNEDMHDVFNPYYLIITNDYFSIKNYPIIENILNATNNLGYSLLISEQSFQRVPKQCNVYLQILEEASYVLYKDLRNQIKFSAEYDPTIDMRLVTIPLASIPLLPPGNEASLPTSLTFLDMFNVSKLEQLNISNRWRLNNPVISLQTPIGVQTNGETFYLDLHEKYHGPHGLVAGTTGSGKSEFLISFLLSLSINYHPEEVQFVIIDYKGGGLAGAFENRQTGAKVPHLVGTITNLDVAEMNRTLVSINSEIKRRQKVFNDARDKLGEGTIDIYKYQQFYREGQVNEPMSHLFIVSDEFAELKAQQPDFMDELISIARIGRSLGIHLILATQKPSGVVTDQIWSNSKFKICLKVQDRSDSMDMLKRPEAASLKDAGRFYLQVGYDEYFDIGQAGWAGAMYNPTNKRIKKTDDSICFIDNTGYQYKIVNDTPKTEVNNSKADQLTSTVKYLIEIAAKENCNIKQLWRTAIPGEIFLNDIKTKYNYQRTPFLINPVIGEYDNPKAQFQGILTIDITNRGNLLIYGATGSGKENLLSTLIYSICVNHHPSEVNIYIVDLGAETLKMYEGMPHVGDICTIDEEEKIQDLINIINKETARRKQLFSDYSGSYINYCKNSGKTEPSIIVIINNYESVDENFNDHIDPLSILFRDANKFGIYFVVTTSTENTMRTRVSDMFNNKICLQMPGEDAYRSILNAPRSLKPLSIFGRGLVALEDGQFEFQTAYICDPIEISNMVKKTSEAFKQYNYQAKKIPALPDNVTLDYVISSMTGLSNAPIGMNFETKEIYPYNFTKNKINVINAMDIEDHIDFFNALIKLLSSSEKINLKVIDTLEIMNQEKLGITIHKAEFDKIIAVIRDEIANEASIDKDNVYLFIGVSELKDKLNDEMKEEFDNIFTNIKEYQKTYFIFGDNYSSYKGFQGESWYSDEVNKKSGIWLGHGVDDQYVIEFPDLSSDDRKIKDSNIGFVPFKSTRIIFKKIVLTWEDTNDK